MIRRFNPRLAWACCATALAGAAANRSCAAQEIESYNHYHLAAAVVSLDAQQSLASYRAGGKGSGTPGAQLGYSTPDVDISIALLLEANRFYADVTTRPRAQSGGNEESKQRIDLTDLRPTSVDLGTDEDGRVYRLNLTPSVVSVRLKPKSFREATDDLYRLKFHASRVMLDDKYVGRMLASDAEMFTVEICGAASLEFSLRRLRGAKPWGRLQGGQILFRHPDGTSIEIGNVTNGAEDRMIDGGPYTVWVRWNDARETVEEYRNALSDYRDQLKSGAAKLVAVATGEALARIDQELAREPGPWITSCGARALQEKEFIAEGP